MPGIGDIAFKIVRCLALFARYTRYTEVVVDQGTGTLLASAQSGAATLPLTKQGRQTLANRSNALNTYHGRAFLSLMSAYYKPWNGMAVTFLYHRYCCGYAFLCHKVPPFIASHLLILSSFLASPPSVNPRVCIQI